MTAAHRDFYTAGTEALSHVRTDASAATLAQVSVDGRTVKLDDRTTVDVDTPMALPSPGSARVGASPERWPTSLSPGSSMKLRASDGSLE
jgi:hypothetical protein